MRRLVITLALVSIAAFVPAASPTASPARRPPAAARGIPSDFRRHQETYWVWYAPRIWIAASGKNDLQISSPTGTLWNTYGASGVVCANTADAWFKYLRENYRDTAKFGRGLYSKPLKAAHFTKIGGTKHLDTYYWRQTVNWAGKRKGGQKIKGEMVMDVFVVDAFSGVCGQRFQVRGAPARGFSRSIQTLHTVQSTITQRNL